MKIILQQDEPLKAIALAEKFTGADLSKIKAKLDGITLKGDLTISEKIDASTSFTAEITIQ